MESAKSAQIGLIVGGLGALLAGSGIGYYLLSKSKADDDGELKDVDDIIDLPDLSKAQVLEMLQIINTNMQTKVRELGQQLAQIEAQMKQAGQSLPEKEICAYLSQEFESHLAKVQGEVLNKFKTDEEEFEESTEYYEEQDDQEVKQAVEQLSTMYKAISGQSATAKEPSKDLTKEKFMEMMEHYFDCMFNSMKSLIDEGKEKGMSPNSPEMQAMMMQHLDARTIEALKEKDICHLEFNGALQKFQHHEDVAMKFHQLQALHQQKSIKLGLQN